MIQSEKWTLPGTIPTDEEMKADTFPEDKPCNNFVEEIQEDYFTYPTSQQQHTQFPAQYPQGLVLLSRVAERIEAGDETISPRIRAAYELCQFAPDQSTRIPSKSLYSPVQSSPTPSNSSTTSSMPSLIFDMVANSDLTDQDAEGVEDELAASSPVTSEGH